MSIGDLSGHVVTHARVMIPSAGTWMAEATLDDDGAGLSHEPFMATLTLAGTSYVGTLVRAPSPYLGALRVRIVGGGGGWRKVVDALAYQSTAGVRLAMVLSDAAREVGERVRIDVDKAIGDAFVRESCPAARVLHQIAPGGWYVDRDGTTVIGDRDTSAIGTAFDLMEHDGGFYSYRVATEAPGDWMPARRFVAPSGFVSVVSVVHTLEENTLRTEVLA